MSPMRPNAVRLRLAAGEGPDRGPAGASDEADNRLAALAVALLLAAREGEGADTPGEEREALELLNANVSRGAAAMTFCSPPSWR